MKTEFEYFSMEELHDCKGSTKQWFCMGKGCQLGLVKWYGAWRQYVFYPECDTIFSSGCLTDIVNFLTEVNELHKLDLIKRKKEANNE